jgi:hypothetical protein
MKIGFRVAPYDQNPPRVIEVNDISSAEEEIKKYIVSPNLVFKYWIETKSLWLKIPSIDEEM